MRIDELFAPAPLTEGRVIPIEWGYPEPVKVFVNPSRQQARTLVDMIRRKRGKLYLRGLMIEDKKVMVWDGWDMTHDDVHQRLAPNIASHSSDYSTFEIDDNGLTNLRPGDFLPARSLFVQAVVDAAKEPSSITEAILNEVAWQDLYPKAFAAFRTKYLKLQRQKKTTGLYVQFTSHKDNTMDRTAHQTPDHSDPVGNYAYPMDYVLKAPADIWYGKGARYLRVLDDTSKNALHLSYIDSEPKCERALNRLGFHIHDVHKMIELARKHHKDRLKGSNRWAKTFFQCVQMDYLGGPIGEDKPGMFSKGGLVFRIRTGAEQTALLRKGGYDALIDTARSGAAAVINDREPEQIVFLTRNAFRVLEVVPLRPGVPEGELPAMTSPDPDTTRIVRPLAAQIAAAMDDRITEWGGDPKLRQKVEFDGPYRSYWTAKGRRIEVTFDRPVSYYSGKKMGVKKHRGSTIADAYMTKVTVHSEIGTVTAAGGSGDTFAEVVDQFRTGWRIRVADPRPNGWVPQNASSFMAAKKAASDEYYRKEAAKKRAATLAEWDGFEGAAHWVADHLGLPLTLPTDPDARYELLDVMQGLRRQNEHQMTAADLPQHMADWRAMVATWTNGMKVENEVMACVDQMIPVIAKGMEKTNSFMILNRAEGIFDVLRYRIEAIAKRDASSEAA